MEQFSLEKWLENPSRKVVTRDGREVRIICTDCKSSVLPIIAEIQNPKTNTWFIDFFNVDGITEIDKQKQRDLFFADEEELTEFEKELEKFRAHILATSGEKYDKNGECVIKKVSRNLLDLARKKDWREPVVAYKNGYEQGKQDALKDLPKWKKATEHKDLEKHIAILEENKVLLSNYLEEGDYYIDLEDLKTLPKEE